MSRRIEAAISRPLIPARRCCSDLLRWRIVRWIRCPLIPPCTHIASPILIHPAISPLSVGISPHPQLRQRIVHTLSLASCGTYSSAPSALGPQRSETARGSSGSCRSPPRECLYLRLSSLHALNSASAASAGLSAAFNRSIRAWSGSGSSATARSADARCIASVNSS